MVLLKDLGLELPLSNPVVIFSLVLFIILFAPILFNKIKVPHIIGLILAGVIVGPYGLGLLKRDSSIVLFGTVGLLYIMFVAGLELDLSEFKKNKGKILIFGLLTFLIPFSLGTIVCYYLLGFSMMSALLVGAMMSTHTLISYPIASKFGVSRQRPVTLAVGGTMITDILALLMLAAVAGLAQGNAGSGFWVKLGLSSLVFAAIVFFVFPLIARWFFKKVADPVSQYIFVLAMVFLASFLAELAGLEPIIGAFFSGLVLNQFVPHASVLMNRIDFVGNAIFIPFFLISVGMLVDLTVFGKGLGALKVAGVMLVTALTAKFLAARITQLIFRMSNVEGKLIHGLSSAHAAATLAIILVGYNIITGETASGDPIRLLNEDVLNGAVLLILVSCTVSSFITQRAAQKLSTSLETKEETGADKQKILIALGYEENLNELIDLGESLKGNFEHIELLLMHVISEIDRSSSGKAQSSALLTQGSRYAQSKSLPITTLMRHDQNIVSGIIHTLREQQISDVIIGAHGAGKSATLLGDTAESLLNSTSENIMIYQSVQPLNTIRRVVLAIPPRAEEEPGFRHWVHQILRLANESRASLMVFANEECWKLLHDFYTDLKLSLEVQHQLFSNWNDFLIIGREVKKNDLFVVVSSRVGHASYETVHSKLPVMLKSYFSANSYLMIYPCQLERGVDSVSEGMNILQRLGRSFKKG